MKGLHHDHEYTQSVVICPALTREEYNRHRLLVALDKVERALVKGDVETALRALARVYKLVPPPPAPLQ